MSAPKIPYPPSPPDVPEGLTDYADSYTKQQNRLLAGLFVFLIFYMGMIVFFAMVGIWCFMTWAHLFILKVIGMVLCGVFFLYLVKGFFKRHPMNKDMHIEITEEEHPVLFGFIHQICEELGAPEPNKVFVSPEVNAAVMPRTSLMNLFVEPKKDLLIGLGLVNCVNLSEFKAVLAHEFGHFSQSAMASSYTYVASRIIGDLVDGEDWLDRFINWCKKQDNAVSIFGHVVGSCLWVGRKILEWFYKVITLQRLAVSREREFHADLVAVSAAGSNAVVHCLLRTEFGHQCYMQAIDDLATALDHKLYTKDLYLHQDRAAAVVRRKKKEPELGLPPVLKKPNDGKDIQVFDAEEEAMAEDIPEMWRTHPANSDREANAKEQFVPAIVDHRSPWLLFTEAAELREQMSYKFYRMVFRVPKGAELAEAQKVQEYIDNEYADTTYDPKYHGAYDDRPLEPGDISELQTVVKDSPWTEERMQKVYDKLFDGCKEHAEAHADLHKELASLNGNVVGKPSPKMKRMIEDTEKKLDENWEWFKSFDRRVFLLHVQMAAQTDPEQRDELIERYRFQLEVQRFYQEARKNFNKADAYITAYGQAARGEIQVPNDFGAEVIAVLRAAWKVLKKIIQDAREINLPAMKNFAEGERLADFILEGKMVPEPPLSELKGVWVSKLMTQLQGVKNRCFRLHFKSLGGILSIQEKAASAWISARRPVAADVLGIGSAEEVVEVVDAAEVVEVIDAAEVVDIVDAAEVIDAVVEPLVDVVPAEAAVAHTSEPVGQPMAAFTAPPPVPSPAVELPKTVRAAPPPLPKLPPPVPQQPAAVEEVLDVVEVVEEVAEVVEVVDVVEVVEEPAPAAPPPAPVAEANPFSFDDEADTKAEPVEKPAAAPKPPPLPAPTPVAEVLPESPVAQALALDAGEKTGGTDFFSLDADELAAPAAKASPAPAPKPPEVKPAAPAPAAMAGQDLLTLDADALPAVKTKPASGTVAAPAAKPAAPRPESGATAAPAARSTTGSGTAPALVTPRAVANVKRPTVKITLVKPGEKSPFAK